jgi:hypothetical protein
MVRLRRGPSGLQTVNFLLQPHIEERQLESSLGSLRALIPFMRALPQDLTTSQRPDLIPSHWGLRFQHTNFKGTQMSILHFNILIIVILSTFQ